jgi:DinB superfamily
MDVSELLLELYGRIPPLARAAVEGLDAARLVERPTPGANSIAWLIWHLTRVQDHHVAELLHADQLWVDGPWAGALGLAPDPRNTGYGHSASDVATIRPRDGHVHVLLDYLDAVDERTRGLLEAVTADDLDRVVDRRWTPPVTLGVRLVSVADDCLQHAGQAAYARGLLGA